MRVAVAALLALAVAGAWLRLMLWWRRAPVRSRGWRLALLAAAQPVVAGLLYLALFPPPAPSAAAGTLVVLTRGGRAGPVATAVALPEAGIATGTEAAPDLSTALRRHPGTRRLLVRGEGLEPRDADAARGFAVVFDPPPARRGIVALAPPSGPVAPGDAFAVGGAAAGLAGGSAALVDPAGREVDRAPLDADGAFALAGAARVAGVALFRVRVRDARGALAEEADVPVRALPTPPVRVLFLAGAPGPEVKYWRRWAADAGVAATTRIALGAGLALGDAAPPLMPASLARVDLAIVDERSWAALAPGERAAVAAAVRGGMGLLLRVTGPLPAALRADWARLGLPLLPADTAVPARLPPRAGENAPPPLTRRVALAPGGGTVALLRGGDGTSLVGWHAAALGRVGAWTLADAAGLVTAGEGARFGELWGATVSTLARPRPGTAAGVSALPVEGARLALCGVSAGARVIAPDGAAAAPLPDPAAGGCAGYWPRRSGWHELRQGADALPFYVQPAAALPALRAAERRERTLALAAGGATAPDGRADGPAREGPAWPWLLLFVAAAAALWWFERASAGRGGA